ncbi:MAG: DUF4921 family protein [bacterium]|nr:DUF4921 family protein [bacterium]
MKKSSELRQDPVTGAWVLIATGRAKRPQAFARKEKKTIPPKENCRFEELMKNALLIIDRKNESYRLTKKDLPYLKKNWFVQVVPNKYPAFDKGICQVERKLGPHSWMDGVGFHEVIISRNHTRPIAEMTQREVESIIKSYRERYKSLKDEDCVEYISIFHNHGPSAGASVFHPHSQLIATPVIPPDISRSLKGSALFARTHKNACVHCVMIDFEMKDKRRIVYENNDFIVFCPFVSRAAFEVHIFPKRHNPRFEISEDDDLPAIADALKTALAKLYKGLGNPDHNFFIHTSPVTSTAEFNHYHWHLEIIPKTAIWAGFEISTGIDISTIAPEKAAKFLRKIKV